MDYCSNKNYYIRKLLDRKADLERCKMTNREHERLTAEKGKLEDSLHQLDCQKDDLKFLIDMANAEYVRFKERQGAYLEAEITDKLAYIFPDREFAAKLSPEYKGRKPKISLNLFDKDGNLHLPGHGEGMLCQYLISFAATLYVIQKRACSTVLVDEAFGAASRLKTPLIGPLIADAAKKMQIILIAQNPDLYSDIPRREFDLSYDPVGMKVHIDNVVDVV